MVFRRKRADFQNQLRCGNGRNNPVIKTTLLAGALFMGSPISAQEESPFELEAEVGYRYDDNITVDENDSNSRRGDSSFLFRANLGADLIDKDKFGFSAGYSFSQSLHDELTEFDLQIHGLSARAKTKVGKVTLAADYRFNFIKLGGVDFLEINSIRPNIGFLLGKKTYLTASYEYRENSFKDVALLNRNAHRHTGASKAYFILGKGKNITLGYKAGRHRATTLDLSYWAHTVDAGLKLPVDIASKTATYRVRYQYRQKNYSGFDADIGAVRGDKRHSIRTSIKIPFGENFNTEFEYRYVDSSSNLASVDYNSHVLTFRLGWSL